MWCEIPDDHLHIKNGTENEWISDIEECMTKQGRPSNESRITEVHIVNAGGRRATVGGGWGLRGFGIYVLFLLGLASLS